MQYSSGVFGSAPLVPNKNRVILVGDSNTPGFLGLPIGNWVILVKDSHCRLSSNENDWNHYSVQHIYIFQSLIFRS